MKYKVQKNSIYLKQIFCNIDQEIFIINKKSCAA